MKLIEKHLIRKSHHRFDELDQACFASKNIFNCAVYLCRQAYFQGEKIPTFNELYHQLKSTDDYKQLPTKVSQLVIKQVSNTFKSYFKAIKEYSKHPDKFTGKPQLPKYKHKTKGRNLLSYNYQAFSKIWLKKGLMKLSGLEIKIPTKLTNITEAKIIPQCNCYVVAIVYEQEETLPKPQGIMAAIDIGLSNLATVTSNDVNFKPFIVCGKAIKSCNQWYNKCRAKLQSFLPSNQGTS